MRIYFFNKRTIKFFESLDEVTQVSVERHLNLLGQKGHMLEMPYSRALGNGLFELRIIDMIHIRLCYSFYNRSVWILHGFVKKTNRISRVDIEYARKQLRNLLQSI